MWKRLFNLYTFSNNGGTAGAFCDVPHMIWIGIARCGSYYHSDTAGALHIDDCFSPSFTAKGAFKVARSMLEFGDQ